MNRRILTGTAVALAAIWFAMAPRDPTGIVPPGADRPALAREQDYWIFGRTALEKGQIKTARRVSRLGMIEYPQGAGTAFLKFCYLVETEQWDEARKLRDPILGAVDSIPTFLASALARLLIHDGMRVEGAAMTET